MCSRPVELLRAQHGGVHGELRQNLHALIAALREEGCQVVGDVQDSEYGKFGWVVDPDGNKDRTVGAATGTVMFR
jgi:hypothetical protein